MKYFSVKFTFLMCIMMIPFTVTQIYSANPTYTVTITNDVQVDSKNYEFDIYLLRTGSTAFSYSDESQYYININSSIINGGSITFSLVSGTSNLQSSEIGALSYNNGQSRLIISASNSTPWWNATTISSTSPGTRIGKFKVTNTNNFSSAQPNLTWYNGVGQYTRVYAWVSFTSTEITNSADNLININNGTLPVVLSSFNYGLMQNNVDLTWVTQSEINNKGFSIERTLSGSRNWESIGFVNGTGNSNHAITYTFTDKQLNTGKYDYRLKQVDYNSNSEYFNLTGDVSIGSPAQFKVSQNYPNPSNPKTNIDYQIPFDGKVSLKVFDMTGKEVAILVNENKSAGYYTAEFDGSNAASGIYFYRITASGNGQEFSKTLKMVLVR